MFKQIHFFLQDYKRATGKYWFRGFYIWMSFSIIGIFFYRLERGLYLLFGESYRFIRIILLPILVFVEALSHLDISYHADIGGGMMILHNAVGVVISGQAKIGKNLTLIGGNVIGAKIKGKISIGDNCTMGANAVIIGPLEIGDNVTIGASACVVKNCPSNAIMVGVPAKNNNNKCR
jgi:serine acetyltransferase